MDQQEKLRVGLVIKMFGQVLYVDTEKDFFGGEKEFGW